MDVGEGIMSVNTNLLTEEERVLNNISFINLSEDFREFMFKAYPQVLGMLFFYILCEKYTNSCKSHEQLVTIMTKLEFYCRTGHICHCT